MLKRIFTLKNPLNFFISSLTFCFILHGLSGCRDAQDRSSSVYGHISDENGNPVDSILVTTTAFEFTKKKRLASVFSDKDGNYEIVVEIPKEYSGLSVNIPFLPDENPKFDTFYQGFTFVYKNDVATNNCCNATVGEKTKYDFQLMPK